MDQGTFGEEFEDELELLPGCVAHDEKWNLALMQLLGSFFPQARGIDGQLLSGEVEEDGWEVFSTGSESDEEDSEEESDEWEGDDDEEEEEEGEGSSGEGTDAGDGFLEV